MTRQNDRPIDMIRLSEVEKLDFFEEDASLSRSYVIRMKIPSKTLTLAAADRSQEVWHQC